MVDEAGDVDLDAGLGEREEVRAQADVALVTEDRAREAQQRALEVGERDVGVDGQPLDLVELRRVGGVGVAPVDAPGDDDVQRRREGLHRARLHRRGVRAQHHVVGDVEGVGARARRVRLGVVERVEVVVDRLDLGAVEHAEAEAEEDVLDLAPGLRDEVVAPDRLGRVAGEGDVDAVLAEPAFELAGLELGMAGRDRLLELAAQLVGRLADTTALLGRQVGDAAQQVGQLGLAPEPLHAHLLERAGGGGRGDGVARVAGDLFDAVDHGRVSS